MSIKTLRKRIAITATSALLAGTLSIVASPASLAHNSVESGTNTATSVGQVAGNDQVSNAGTSTGSLFVATKSNTTTSAVAALPASTSTGTCAELDDLAASKGLLYKDSSSGIAQSATVLPGAVLSLYSCTATAAAFVASGGSFVAQGGLLGQGSTWSYSSNNRKAWSEDITTTSGTGVAALWTAPSTVGTYTVSLYTGHYATSSSPYHAVASASTDTLPETLSGNITVTVAATSAGGDYSATNSLCQAVRGTNTYSSSTSSNVDDSGTNANGVDWSVDFFLRDAYGASLGSTGNIVATSTNGALLAFGTAGTTPVAGTTTTVTSTSTTTSGSLSGIGYNSTLRVSQKTAGVPITTTVTISYNGTVVCTKTVSIAGTVAALTVPAANIAVQDLSSSTGNSKWFGDGTGRDGTFYVVATDSVGNRIATPSSIGTYGVVSGSTGTTVTNVTVGSLASSASSSSPLSASVGSHTCAATAGTQAGVKLKFTLADGTVITSAPFDLKCADDPYTVSASFDKAKYLSGEVAKLTVSFKDSKGNVANNATAYGASTISVPGMTLVSTTGAADAVAAAGGKVEYTYTVGQTAGKYAAVVDFTGALVYSAVQNPSYEIATGGDTTTNADVLKSIVALIASINKQIAALQKLILQRR